MTRIIRWFRSLGAWRVVHQSAVHDYEQNQVTGKRRAIRRMAGGHCPVDTFWLAGHSDTPFSRVLSPPTGGSGVLK